MVLGMGAAETDLALEAERADWRARIAALEVTDDELQAQVDSLTQQIADCQNPPVVTTPIGSSRGNYFGHKPDVLRIYLQPGEKPARWLDNTDCVAVLSGQQCVFSKKEQDPAWLASFLSTVPASIGTLRVVCGIHEPENDPITAATYLSWVKADAAVVRAAGFIPVQCLMNARDGKWATYASPDIDEMWWDPYQGGVATHPKQYNAPAKFLGPIITASSSKGKPWGLGEVGSLATLADTTEVGRANWMADLREFIIAHPQAKGACWFNRAGNLLTQQLADAWLAGQRP